MKRLDQLGISPTPWSVNLVHPGYVIDSDDNVVVTHIRGMDAKLISAAPELYEALNNLVKLHEDCSKNDCDECPRCLGNGRKCDIEEDELLEAAYRALAKASGEEVSS